MQQRYIGTKIVLGSPMTRQAYNDYRGWPLPAGENGADEGYLVEYQDGGPANDPRHAGYISWSPKAVFEGSYRRTAGLTFGMAIEALKQGAKIARAGWNGRGMFVYLVPANAYPASTEAAKSFFGDALVPYNAYMALKGVDGKVSTWVPSVTDALAEDWQLVDISANTLAPHQQRVVDEKTELDERLVKLQAFVVSPLFPGLPKEEQERLRAQLALMVQLSTVLADRISHF